MLSFDGSSPNSILILDNASVHHTHPIQSLLKDCGILAIFLPPYSPDYNPIELAFSYVKYYLKLHEDIVEFASHKVLIEAAFKSITKDYCCKWIEHCGY